MNPDTLVPLGAVLFKITAVLLFAVALVRLLHRAEPRWRVLAARATFLALPLLLVASAIDPRLTLPLLPPESAPSLANAPAISAPVIPLAEETVPAPAAAPLPQPATALLATWFLVALALALRDTIRLRRFNSERGLANTVLAEETLTAEWSRACAELGLRAPELRLSREKASPFLTSGFFKALVIPEQLSSIDNRERLRHVFRHEAAHLAHRDRAWIPLARILTCFLWFHPLAWWLASLHLRACEEACDARAARLGGTRAYSGALAALALELVPQESPATAFLRLPSVRDRLRAVKHHARLTPPTRAGSFPIVTAITVLAILAGNLGIAQQVAPDPAPAAENPAAAKLHRIILPRVEFNETPFEHAIAFLRQKGLDLDPEKRGVNILIAADAGHVRDTTITLQLTNAPLTEALRYTAQLANAAIRIDPEAVMITKAPEKPAPESSASTTGTGKTGKKLSAIVVPRIEFRDTPLDDAINYLRSLSAQLDTGGGETRGINIIVAPGVDLEKKITLRLSNIALADALRYITELSETTYRVDSEAVFIAPANKASTELLFTKVYALPKNVFEAECRRYRKTEAKDLLTETGIDFPPGAAAIYNPATAQLVIRNTEAQNALIEAWVGAAVQAEAEAAR